MLPSRHTASTLAGLFALATIAVAAPALAHPAPFPHSHDEHPPSQPLQAPPAPVEEAPVYVETPSEPAAKPWRRPVFHLGIGGVGSAIACERGQNFSCDMEGGGGLNLFLGWRIGGVFGVDFDGTLSFHDAPTAFDPTMKATLTTLAANMRFYLVPSSLRIEPYAMVGLGGTVLSRDSDALPTLRGPSLSLGAGIDINLTRRLAFGIKGSWRGAWLEDRSVFAFDPVEKSFLSTVTVGAHVQIGF